MRRLLLVLLGLALLAPVTSASADPPLGRLSDERTLTRWATPVDTELIHAHPRRSSPRVARLRLATEDDFPEVYLLLASARDAEGQVWVKLRIPGRPNGRRGWVRREALGAFRVVRTRLVVDRRRLRAVLYDRGRAVLRLRIGVGKARTPTPRGWYWVREGFRVVGAPTYGPYALGTSAYSVLSDWPGGGVVGIHGTNRPELIPGRPSHGCIRLRNRDVLKLARRMPIGTPVRIR